MGLRVIDLPVPEPMQELAAHGSEAIRVVDVVIDVTRHYHAIVSRDPIVPGDLRWHVSVSGEHDVPRWKDLVAIGHELRPGICFCVGVPPRSWWMNSHPHCLHLWELKDEQLVEQWRFESRGDTPT